MSESEEPGDQRTLANVARAVIWAAGGAIGDLAGAPEVGKG